MAGETQMIIITSNEDLIRRFTANIPSNTRIIDLEDNNNINLTVLTELSKFKSNNHQIHKRIIDSSDVEEFKQVKLTKKICQICGDHAIGYNYDVLSCASCKAFFIVMLINNQLEQLKCLKGQNQCIIAYKINRKCYRCRLKRCLTMGMRKDFLLNEEEKQRRKKQNISSISNSMDMNKNIVLNEIKNIQSKFLSIFQVSNQEFDNIIDLSDRASALISWSTFTNQIALRLINFFRQINEFENLDNDDRFILIKYNLFPAVFIILKCYYYSPINDSCSYGNHEKAEKKRLFHILCDQSNDIREMLIDLILFLVSITEQDQILISFLLIILLFYQ